MTYPTSGAQMKKLVEMLAPATFAFDPAALNKELVRRNIALSGDIAEQVAAALNSGKHIILVGAPGTAKTTVAEAICSTARQQALSHGDGVLATATSDWSTFDTVGGYMPTPSGSKLEFAPGIIVRAIAASDWLILDEVNRADIDKAIGPIFSVLSGQGVTLPYRTNAGNAVRIVNGPHTSSDGVYVVSPNWRIIATMNDLDKQSLFTVSYAFMRRFAIIRIPAPSPADMVKIVTQRVPDCDVKLGIQELTRLRTHREMGPALFIDMATYIAKRAPLASQTVQHTREAFAAFLLPQLDAGVPRDQQAKLSEIVRHVFPDFKWGEEFAVSGPLSPQQDAEAPNQDGIQVATSGEQHNVAVQDQSDGQVQAVTEPASASPGDQLCGG